MLQEGAAAMRQAWQEARRPGQPRIVTGRYFGFGRDADTVADEYIRHYYGDAFSPAVRADTSDRPRNIWPQRLRALREAGTTDVILYPTSSDLEQIDLLANALQETGFLN